MRTRDKIEIFAIFLTSFLAAILLSGCGGSSSNSTGVGADSLAPGSSVAQIQWQNGAQISSESVRLQLDSQQGINQGANQGNEQRDWDGIDVLHLEANALPDGVTIETARGTLGEGNNHGGPDHQHAKQEAILRVLNGGVNEGSSGGAAAQVSDQGGNLVIRAQDFRNLVPQPSCGAQLILEVDLQHARLLLPLELDC